MKKKGFCQKMEIKKWICVSSSGLLSFPVYCVFKVLLKRRVKPEKEKKIKKEKRESQSFLPL